ncbi:MAG: hypothetical protein JOZ85_05145 [Betaproteobacteria bacterium]|nr:hypothetical protein [Betaproteobacteria bacterium]
MTSRIMKKAGAGPLFLFLALNALPVFAEDMQPNKDPVPSPSDIRAQRGEDRPQGQAPEDRTPSPSDLAVEQPRVDGDRPTDTIPANPAAGRTQPIPENDRGEPIPTPGR